MATSFVSPLFADMQIPRNASEDKDAVMSKAYWDVWNDDVQKKIDADIEANRKADAVINIGSLAKDSKVKVVSSGTEYSLAPSSALSQEQSGDLLNNLTSPMALVGTWENVAGSTAVANGDEIVFAAMPTWKGNQPGPFTKTKGFVINKNSSNLDVAMKILINKITNIIIVTGN